MSVANLDGRPLILIVEDDEDCRIIFSAALEHAGFAVIEATKGDDGVRLAVSAMPRVILLDIALPVLSGFEVMRELRTTPARGIPVVAITGLGMIHQQQTIAKEPFAQVLLKPVRPNAVVSAVRDVLAKQEKT